MHQAVQYIQTLAKVNFVRHQLPKPKSKYGDQNLNEIFASNFIKSYDASMIGLRFFSVYGPFGRPDMAYCAFLKL